MNEHLEFVLDQLRGVNEDLDAVADRIEALATRTYSRDERQTVIARIAGNADDDLVTALALLVQHLTIVPAEQPMDDNDREKARLHGEDAYTRLTDWHLRGPASAAAALIDISGQCSVCGGTFDDWNGGICTACQNTNRT
jgi:hypothetical protein